MTRKIFFTSPFIVPTEPSRFASLVVTLRGYKAGMIAPAQCTSSRTISHHSSTSFPTAEKIEENRETNPKNRRELLSLWREASLSFRCMAESSWPASEVTQEHLQNLLS
jgi:hypothetical protein